MMSGRYLAGDIGGTNIRLRLHEFDPSTQADSIIAAHTYQSKLYKTVTEALQQFIATYSPDHPIFSCCLALAGPIAKNECIFTNLNWHIKGADLSSTLHIPYVQLVNDFVAAGYGCLALPSENLIPVNEPDHTIYTPSEHAVKQIIGAGTGLGEAFAVHNGQDYIVYPTEGGHSDFAARNDEEYAVMKYVQKKLDLHHVSVERLVSGTAIPHIYNALKDLNPELVKADIDRSVLQGDIAVNISMRAKDKSCPICVKTIDLFVGMYGSECGNQALKLLPFGGIYIAGGIATKIMWAMKDSRFVANFIDKGRMKPVLASIPIYVATGAEVGLMGAAVVAKRLYVQHHPHHPSVTEQAQAQITQLKEKVAEGVHHIVSKL